jgi:hypothetical protein
MTLTQAQAGAAVPESCHAPDAQRGWPTPAGVAQVRAAPVTRRRPCTPWHVITPEAGSMRSRQDGA